MKAQDFTTSFTVNRPPEEVYKAIQDVRSWWSGHFEGETEKPGDQFVYRYGDVHRSTQKVTELIPGKRIVWGVSEAQLNFVENHSEWNGTELVFEIAEKCGETELRFTHVGLVPAFECYGGCSSAWGTLIGQNLRNRIIAGQTQPDVFA